MRENCSLFSFISNKCAGAFFEALSLLNTAVSGINETSSNVALPVSRFKLISRKLIRYNPLDPSNTPVLIFSVSKGFHLELRYIAPAPTSNTNNARMPASHFHTLYLPDVFPAITIVYARTHAISGPQIH